MKNKITLSLIISLLVLSKLFSFAKLNNFEKIHNNITSITTACEVQDAPSIFVLDALFANPENPYPVELWQNRDNEQINIFDIAREIKSIASLKEKIFNNADDAKRTHLFERLAQMEDIADRALIMEADKWKASYVNELMKHIIGIRHYGISDLLPDAIDPNNCKDGIYSSIEEEFKRLNVIHLIDNKDLEKLIDEEKDSWNRLYIINPCDKNGVPWTSLTALNDKNNYPSVADYMRHHLTDIEVIMSWWNDQVGDSWLPGILAIKAFYAHQRTIDLQEYYWSVKGYKAAEKEYITIWKNDSHETTKKEEYYIKAFIIWHAYVQEILSKTKFYHNHQDNKQVCLTRTTGLNTLKSNKINDFGRGYTMPSAVYESFSLIRIFNEGEENKIITESIVPHHRILHLYPLMSSYGPDKTDFPAHFYETEFIVLSGPDLSFDYFYNADEDLSLLRENLENGKGACKGHKLTDVRD